MIGPARAAAAERAARRPTCSVGDGTILGGDPAGPQVRGRGDLGRDRRRHDHPGVLHDQPRAPRRTYRTVVGARCFIMTYVHLAHDCHVGDDVIIANGTQLAGHVTIQDRAILSGLNAIHQFVTIGDLRLRRRRLPGQPGHPALREGGRQSDGAVRAQLDRPPARRLLRRDHRRAQAGLPALLQLRPQPVAGPGARARAICRRCPRSSASSTSWSPPSGACRRERDRSASA